MAEGVTSIPEPEETKQLARPATVGAAIGKPAITDARGRVTAKAYAFGKKIGKKIEQVAYNKMTRPLSEWDQRRLERKEKKRAERLKKFAAWREKWQLKHIAARCGEAVRTKVSALAKEAKGWYGRHEFFLKVLVAAGLFAAESALVASGFGIPVLIAKGMLAGTAFVATEAVLKKAKMESGILRYSIAFAHAAWRMVAPWY